jgi:hypothetical protein
VKGDIDACAKSCPGRNIDWSRMWCEVAASREPLPCCQNPYLPFCLPEVDGDNEELEPDNDGAVEDEEAAKTTSSRPNWTRTSIRPTPRRTSPQTTARTPT